MMMMMMMMMISYVSIWHKSFIVAVTNSFFENWNLYQSFHDKQFTLSLQFFSKYNYFYFLECVSRSFFFFCTYCVHFLSKNVIFQLYLAQIVCFLTSVLLDRKQKTFYSMTEYSLSVNAVPKCKMLVLS